MRRWALTLLTAALAGCEVPANVAGGPLFPQPSTGEAGPLAAGDELEGAIRRASAVRIEAIEASVLAGNQGPVRPTTGSTAGGVSLKARIAGGTSGKATVRWSAEAGRFARADALETTWAPPAKPGKYRLVLTITLPDGCSVSDGVTVEVGDRGRVVVQPFAPSPRPSCPARPGAPAPTATPTPVAARPTPTPIPGPLQIEPRVWTLAGPGSGLPALAGRVDGLALARDGQTAYAAAGGKLYKFKVESSFDEVQGLGRCYDVFGSGYGAVALVASTPAANGHLRVALVMLEEGNRRIELATDPQVPMFPVNSDEGGLLLGMYVPDMVLVTHRTFPRSHAFKFDFAAASLSELTSAAAPSGADAPFAFGQGTDLDYSPAQPVGGGLLIARSGPGGPVEAVAVTEAGSGSYYLVGKDQCIYRTSYHSGTTVKVAGSGAYGDLDGPALSASFYEPRAIVRVYGQAFDRLIVGDGEREGRLRVIDLPSTY